MAIIIQDRDTERRIIARRRRLGHDAHDEVWNGIYVIPPITDDEHQQFVGELCCLLYNAVRQVECGSVYPGINVSDREHGWKRNYRCPDVAVFTNDTAAMNCHSHYFGGPDFGIEIASKCERVKKKLAFYAKVSTRELLIVDRYPWNLSLYRLVDGKLQLAGTSSVAMGEWLKSNVLPLSFRLIDGIQRPRIDVQHADGQQTWVV